MVVHMQAEQHNPIMDRERETVLINIFAEDKIIDAKTYNKDCLNIFSSPDKETVLASTKQGENPKML